MESNTFSLAALSRAIEGRNSAAMRGFYADDAKMTLVDRDHPPSKPQEIAGGRAIAAYFDDVCGRTMTHHVEDICLDANHLAFTQACTYPDGKRVHLLGHGGIEGRQDRQADDRAGLGRVNHDHRTLVDRCPFRA